MKRLLLLSLVMSIVFLSCKKKDKDDDTAKSPEPTQAQWGWVVNYTATWCGPCGNWGAPLIHTYEAAGNVVAITAHASNDPMYIANLYTEFNADRTNGGGIPSFWVGDVKTTSEGEMATLLGKVPEAGVAFFATNSGSEMTVELRVKFFNAASGDYYLSVYLLQDGIDGSASSGEYAQNGVANPDTYKHDFVLRASATNNAYGELLTSGSVDAGATFDKDYTIPIDGSWGTGVYAAAVLWRYDTSTGVPNYKYINAYKIK